MPCASDNFQDYCYSYYFLAPLGRNTKSVAIRLLTLLLAKMTLPERLPALVDDSPTRHPSHADRRKALRRTILRNELSTLARA